MVTRRKQDPAPAAGGELAALADQADRVDADNPDTRPGGQPDHADQPGDAPPPPPLSRAESNAFRLGVLLRLVRDLTAAPELIDPPLKALAAGLPDDRVDFVAGAWGTALDDMGVDFMGGLPVMDHPAVRAAVMTAPVLVPVGRALWRELKERRPVDVQAKPAAADAADGAP